MNRGTHVRDAIQAIIAARFTGSNQLLSPTGYQKFPGGLVIQWGAAVFPASVNLATFPISFNMVPRINITGAVGGPPAFTIAPTATATTFPASNNSAGNESGLWMAIGH